MRSRWHDRDIIKAAVDHAIEVAKPTDDSPGLTEHGALHAAAALALVLSSPDHWNHAASVEKHLPPTGVENGRPYDAYCEDCGQRVTRRRGAWWCEQHRDLGGVKFVERPAISAVALPSGRES